MKKLVSVLMAVLFIVCPAVCGPNGAGSGVSAETQDVQEPEIVEEAEWLREKNSETYLLSNGYYECVVYSENKYFENASGALELIDNSVIRSVSTHGGREYGYRNKANDHLICFEEDRPGVYISAKGQEISYALQGGNAASCTVGGHDTLKELAGFALSGDNCVTYNGVFVNTDIVYAVSADSVKEYIVINDSSAPHEFVFTYETNGLSVMQLEDGSYALCKNGEPVFGFGMLFAVDANECFTDAVYYDFETDGEELTVTVSVDEEYLSDPDRAYPVVIDPTIMITGENDTKDSYVSSRYPNNNYYMNNYVKTGRDADYYVRRTYMGFTLPTAVMGKTVTSAFIKIKKYTGSAPSIKAYRVTGSWTSSTITWNNKPGVTSTNASANATVYSGSWYRLYVTDIVKSWVNGTYSNYGFMIKDNTESGTSQWTAYYSSDAPSPNKPELHITYYCGARAYELISDQSINCMGYALQVARDLGPSDIGLTAGDIQGHTVSEILNIVKDKIDTWLHDHTRSSVNPTGEIVDYYACSGCDVEIPQGYYLVVFRVGVDPNYLDNEGEYFGDAHHHFGYHWRYLTSSGYWAEKMGFSDSELLSDTLLEVPGTSSWVSGNIVYNSACVYYLIKNKAHW